MTTPVEANSLLLKSAAGVSYPINNSLRFRSSASAYLSRTPASASNRKTWTWSAWVKRGTLGVSQYIFAGGTGGTDTTQNGLNFQADDTLRWTGTATAYRVTSQVFRDPSAWYHLIVAFDTTQATANDRIKFFVNGVQVTSFSTTVNPTQNVDYAVNQAAEHDLARYTGASNYFDGYMAEANFIDGQALTPSSFGAYNSYGVWQPARYTGTYGTNGFYLKFASFGTAAALGTDSSGNGNTWTVNNISVTAGTTYDPMLDSPTLTSATVANYATLNPIGSSLPSVITITNGNLTATTSVASPSNFYKAGSTIAVSSGKWYFEDTVTALDVNNWAISIAGTPPIQDTSNQNGLLTGEVSYFAKAASVETIYVNNSATYTGSVAASAGDIIGVAFDAGARTIQFYRNNTAVSTAQTINSATTYYVSLIVRNNTTAAIHNVNFGQRPFTYTAPSGYVALNAYNLPAPTIANGASYMAATTYTGTGAVQSISDGSNTTTNVTFQPDLVWIKSRSAATNNNVFDSLRTATNYLITNSTAVNATNANTLTAFNSTGFALGSDASSIGVNISTNTYVAWQWLAGAGTSSTNTNGSITSTVSVNPTAGFSIVTYTGTGANATVGHGLGVAPSMFVVKGRNNANHWAVYHASTGATNVLYLDSTIAATAGSAWWNNTAPTSNVFSIGTSNDVNSTSSSTYVAYCWSAVAGYSAFGLYLGNGSTDGPFVYTGFRPRFILFKNASTAGYNWFIYDTSRQTYNVMGPYLSPNLPDAEATFTTMDILSNGFKVRDSSAFVNSSGSGYIYAAFAENPFKYALAR
jgi:hypothetical protein